MTTACASGMNDTTGVGYMSSLMAFLVVFRFVNMYQRVINARSQIGHAETALRRICVLLHGMVHPPERWDSSDRCVKARLRLAAMSKLAFGMFCLAVNEPEEKSRTMTEQEVQHIMERVAKQYEGVEFVGKKYKTLKEYIEHLDGVEDVRAESRSKHGLDIDGGALLTAAELNELAEKADACQNHFELAKDKDTRISVKLTADELLQLESKTGKKDAANSRHAKAWKDGAKRLRKLEAAKLKEQAEKTPVDGTYEEEDAAQSQKAESTPYVKYKQKLRSLYMYACVDMLSTVEGMATGTGGKIRDTSLPEGVAPAAVFKDKALIRNTPAQYGQIVVEIRGLMGGFLGTEQCIDIFRDRTEAKHGPCNPLSIPSYHILAVWTFP